MTDELRLKDLLRRGLAGDQAAYRAILSELGTLLERQIRRQLGAMGQFEGHAEDVVQEALMAIHAKRHTYDWQVPVTAWARAIARYKLIDLMRKWGGWRRRFRSMNRSIPMLPMAQPSRRPVRCRA